MKNYSEEVIKKLQETVLNNTYELQEVTTETFPKIIYANGVKVTLTTGNMPDAIVYYGFTFDHTNAKEWRREGFGKFLCKDWKKQNLNIYKIAKFHIAKDLVAIGLIREVSQEETGEEWAYLTDLIIDTKHYCLIKLYVDDLESFGVASHFEENTWCEKLIDQYSIVSDEDSSNITDLQDAANVTDDTMNSEELF